MSWVPENYWYTDELGNYVQGVRHLWVDDGLRVVQPAGYTYTPPAVVPKTTTTTTAQTTVKTSAMPRNLSAEISTPDDLAAQKAQDAIEAQRQALIREAAAAAQRAAQRAIWLKLQEETKRAVSPRGLQADAREDLDTVAAEKAAQERDLALQAGFSAEAERLARVAQIRAAQKVILTAATKPDTKTMTTLEAAIKAIQAEQHASNGNSLDVVMARETIAAYAAAAERVKLNYAEQVEIIRAYFVQDADGKLIRAKGEKEWAAAQAVLASAEFKAAEGEFFRLYGTNGKDGVAAATANAYDQIAVDQREYLKNIAIRYVVAESNRLNRQGEGSEIPDLWTTLRPELAMAMIDPGKTSIKEWIYHPDADDPQNVGMEPVYRTVEEEYEYRTEQFQMELERQRLEYERQVADSQQVADMFAASPEGRQFEQEGLFIASAIGTLGLRDIKTAEDAQLVVQQAMAQWDRQYRSLLLNGASQAALDGDPTHGRGRPSADRTAYEKARSEAEIRFYERLGQERPELLDMLISFGPVKGLLDTLGASFGALGSLTKAAVSVFAQAPAELAATAGNVTIDSFPPEVRARLEKMARDRLSGASGLAVNTAYAAELQKVIVSEGFAWLRGEGAVWRDQHDIYLPEFGISTGQTTKDKARIVDQLRTFYQGFYVNGIGSLSFNTDYVNGVGTTSGLKFEPGQGSPGDKLASLMASLTAYGMEPFNPQGAGGVLNLAAQIGLDPLNALPLNVMTWLKRTRYALETTKDVGGLTRAASATRKWFTVNEGTLKSRKYLTEISKALNNGKSADDLATDIEMRLAGLGEKSAMRKALEAWRRNLGIDQLGINTDELFALVEDRAIQRLRGDRVRYSTMTDELAAARKSRDADIEAERLAREARIAADTGAKLKSDTLREAEAAAAGAAARSGELVARKTAEERAKDALAAAATRRVPKKRVASAAPPPKPPDLYRTPEHPNPIRVTVTETTSPVVVRATGEFDFSQDWDAMPESLGGKRVAKEAEGAKVTIIGSDTPNPLLPVGARPETTLHGMPFQSRGDVISFRRTVYYKEVLELMAAGKVDEAARIVYEAGRKTIARAVANLEGASSVRLTGGRLRFADIEDQVTGVRKPIPAIHHTQGGVGTPQQYIPTSADTGVRAGAKTASAEKTIRSDIAQFEKLKIKVLDIAKKLRTGKLTQEQADLKLAEIRTWGIEWHGADGDYLVEMTSGRLGLVQRTEADRLDGHWIAVGDQLVEDVLGFEGGSDVASAALARYYESFSVLNQYLPTDDPFLMRILDPEWRAGMPTPQRVATTLSEFDPQVSGIRDFRERGNYLFSLFHMLLLEGGGIEGKLDRLSYWSMAIQKHIEVDPDNVLFRMWKVMETRAGVRGADDFSEVEESFLRAVLTSEANIHPNLALAMISYGPVARPLSSHFGLPRLLQGMIADTGSKVFRSPDMTVTDSVALRIVSGIIDRAKWAPARILQAPSAVAQYLAREYGGALRRQAFTLRRQDGNIVANFRTMSEMVPGPGFKGMADGWNEFVDEALTVLADIRVTQGDVPLSREDALRDFERRFAPLTGKAGKKGQIEFPPALREMWEEKYWRGEVSHDNYGLHTLNLYMKFMEPKLQNGDGWRRYAMAYLDHMEFAGHLAEGRAVVRGLDPFGDLARTRELAFAGKITTKGRGSRAAVPDSVRFWERAGIVFDPERQTAALRAQEAAFNDGVGKYVAADEGYRRTVGSDRAEAVQRDAWMAEDPLAEATKRVERSSLDLEDSTDRIHVDLDALESLGIRVFDEAPVQEFAKDFRIAAREGGWGTSEVARELAELGPDVQYAIRRDALRQRVAWNLERIVRDLPTGVPSADVTNLLLGVRNALEVSAHGEVILQRLGDEVGETLFETRVKSLLGYAGLRSQDDAIAGVKGSINDRQPLVAKESEDAAARRALGVDAPPAVPVASAAAAPSAAAPSPAAAAPLPDVSVLPSGSTVLHRGGVAGAPRLADEHTIGSGIYYTDDPSVAELYAARRGGGKTATAVESSSVDTAGFLDLRDPSGKGNVVLPDSIRKEWDAFLYGVVRDPARGWAAQGNAQAALDHLRLRKPFSRDDIGGWGTVWSEMLQRRGHPGLVAIEGGEGPFRALNPTSYVVFDEGRIAVPPSAAPGSDFVPGGPAMLNAFDGPLNHPAFHDGGASVFHQMDYGPLYVGAMSKIHVAATAFNGQRILAITDSLAREMKITYKWVKSKTELLDGAAFGKGGVQQGKFITVYPKPVEAREFAERLDAELRAAGITGGDVAPTERRYAPDSPIAHRFVPDASAAGSRYGLDGGYGDPGAVDSIGFRDPAAAGPDPYDFESVNQSHLREYLKALTKLTEEQWLTKELAKAQRGLDKATTQTAKAPFIERIQRIRLARKAIEIAKRPGGRYTTPESRVGFARRVAKKHGERARAVFSPKAVAARIKTAEQALVEQSREEWRQIHSAQLGVAGPAQPTLGAVSATYAAKSAEIEKVLRKVLPEAYVDRLLDAGLTFRVTALDVLAAKAEILAGRLPKDPLVKRFEVFERRVDEALRAAAGGRYSVLEALMDRQVVRSDYLPAAAYEELDGVVADALAKYRGKRANSVTRLRLENVPAGSSRVFDGEKSIAETLVKSKALVARFQDPMRYSEARRVLRAPMVRRRTAAKLYAGSERVADAGLRKLKLTRGTPVGDAKWEELRSAAFDVLRERAVVREANSKLMELSGGTHFLADPDDIIKEFEARYGSPVPSGTLTQQPMTTFQYRTLQESFRTHSGGADPTNMIEVRAALARENSAPPWPHKGDAREWLVRDGVWSPRTAEEIESLRQRSWSIFEEADYYQSQWAVTPEWADPDLLRPGGVLSQIRHEQEFYEETMRRWGVFETNLKPAFANLSREQRIAAQISGDPSLGIRPRRDVATERRFVLERYGELASPDGQTLTAFPWLMTIAEKRAYIKARARDSIAASLVSNDKQLDSLLAAMDKHLDKYWDEFIGDIDPATGIIAGHRVPGWPDLFKIEADIVRDLVADPAWNLRSRDKVGGALALWQGLNFANVFSQLAFLSTNVFDAVAVKAPWLTFKHRAYMSANVSDEAVGFTAASFNMSRSASLTRDLPEVGVTRINMARGESKPKLALAIARGVTELPLQGAAMVEMAVKLRLAQHMYDGVKREFMRELKNDRLAGLAAREYVGKEVMAAWPTVGDGPIERLVNQMFPFLSYQFKNRTFYIGELANHPALFNYFNRIGDMIERYNTERWEEEHPGELMSPAEARRLELPWAPGIFFDLGGWSDVQRAWKPIHDLVSGKPMTVRDFAAYFVRLTSPAQQNIVGGIFNQFNLFPRYQWRPEFVDGEATGKWEKFQVPWESPWGAVADPQNSFWPLELWRGFKEAGGGEMTVQEATVLIFQLLTFGGARQHDVGAGINRYYWALHAKNEQAAKDFLKTEKGGLLLLWWASKRSDPQEAFMPADIAALLKAPKFDPAAWLHSQPGAMQDALKIGWDALKAIRTKWDNHLWTLDPGSTAYREARLQAKLEEYEYYRMHPELYAAEAAGQTATQWAAELDRWKLSELADNFFANRAPRQKDFASLEEWLVAYKNWRLSREIMLSAYPQLARLLQTSRNGMDVAWKAQEERWFEILDRISMRKIAIRAAKDAEDFDLADQLYIMQELDYSLLESEGSVFYFDPATDFVTLPKGVKASEYRGRQLISPDLLPRLKVLNDFTSWRFSRMTEAEKSDFERDQRYVAGIKAIVAKAKAAGKDKFGMVFVTELKKDPVLLEEYFRRNRGKREEWAANDDYIRLIGRFGQLMRAGKFDQGRTYFDALPDWVKVRYYDKHPERRGRVADNLAYMGFMKKWVAFYDRKDIEGGNTFFDSMPQWVRDRYLAKNPDSGMAGGTRGSEYSRAMGGWVALLEAGKKDEALAYFKALPQWVKDRYLAKHPDSGMGAKGNEYATAMGEWVGLLKDGKRAEGKAYFEALPQWMKDRYYEKNPAAKLRTDMERLAQLVRYFGSDDANRAEYLAANPELGQWLAAQSGGKLTRQMMIMAAYAAIPQGDQWLRGIFRNRYPEIFSREAKGEVRVAKVARTLAENGDLTGPFLAYMKEVIASFGEAVRFRTRPAMNVESDVRDGRTPKRRSNRSRSAAWVRIHTP